MKLTRNQAFMAKHAGVQVPFMPVHGECEMKLFTRLIANSTDAKPDLEQMALNWVKHVDGVDVFPKLPVYLRTYYTTWTRNQGGEERGGASEAGERATAAGHGEDAPQAEREAGAGGQRPASTR